MATGSTAFLGTISNATPPSVSTDMPHGVAGAAFWSPPPLSVSGTYKLYDTTKKGMRIIYKRAFCSFWRKIKKLVYYVIWKDVFEKQKVLIF